MPRKVRTEKKGFSESELKVFQQSESPKGDIIKIRIVSYGGGAPQLEKRAFHPKPEGLLMGKCKGWFWEDVQFLESHFEEINNVFTDFQIKFDSRKKGDGRLD